MSPNPSTPPPGGHDQAPIDVDELDSDFEVLSYSPAKGIANAVSKPTKTIDLTADDNDNDDDDVVCVDAPNFFPIGKRRNPHQNGQPMVVGTLLYPSGNCALIFDPYGRTLVQAEKKLRGNQRPLLPLWKDGRTS